MYNYLEAVKEDVRNYVENEINIEDYEDREELDGKLNDDLFVDDSVTGNASGSYFCDGWKAEEALSHNWELIEEAAEMFGIEPKISCGYEYGAEWWDVTIRCYLLGRAVSEVLDEYEF